MNRATQWLCVLAFFLLPYATFADHRNINCPDPDPNQPHLCTDNWGLDLIDQRNINQRDGVYSVAGDGSGVHIYILDSGIDPAQEFSDVLGLPTRLDTDCDCGGSPWACEGGCYYQHSDAFGLEDCRAIRHGTRLASLAGGRRFGVANGVTLLPVKISNDRLNESYTDRDPLAEQDLNSCLDASA